MVTHKQQINEQYFSFEHNQKSPKAIENNPTNNCSKYYNIMDVV